MQLPASTRIILDNFSSDADFLKVANVLNNIVDTKRLFEIVSINASETKFYSMTDETKTIITKPTKDVLIYEKFQAKPLKAEHIAQLNQQGTVVYRLQVNTDKYNDKFLIADESFIPLDDEPENRDAIALKYAQFFEQHKHQYNYVSLENIVPLDGKFFDLIREADENLLFPIGKYNQQNIPTLKTIFWGVRQDPRFDCNYDIANKSISFDFNASDGQYRSATVMNDFLKSYADTEIRMSTLNEFASIAMRDEDIETFPQIIQCMYRLYLQTSVDFTVKLTSIN